MIKYIVLESDKVLEIIMPISFTDLFFFKTGLENYLEAGGK